MEISESSAARMRRVTEPSTRPAEREPAGPLEAALTDSIEVSPEGRSLIEADELTRARRIAELRASVDAGTYTVDPAELARRLAEQGEA